MSEKYKAEFQPVWRLMSEESPPISTKCLFLSRWGTVQVGHFHPEYDYTAWCPLPGLTEAQKSKLNEEEKVRYARNLKKLQDESSYV